MMKERRLSREVAMQLLYQWELQGLLNRKHEASPTFLEKIDLEIFLGHFLHNFYTKDKSAIDMPFIVRLVKGCVGSLAQVDALLGQASARWKLDRIDAIDRAILRVATYELAIEKELSARIIINEAIEIAKRYGSEQSPSFINGLLDNLNSRL